MIDFKKELEKKWGCFEKDEFFFKQCNIKSISPRTFLNVLFIPIKKDYIQLAEKALECNFPEELFSFYQTYNGIMLFSQSFRIFGINKYTNTTYKTLDIVLENACINIKKRAPMYSNLISFGYYAEYSFFFDKYDHSKIFVISRNTFKLYHTFGNLQELFDYYVPKLIDKYNEEGLLINRNPNSLLNDCIDFL